MTKQLTTLLLAAVQATVYAQMATMAVANSQPGLSMAANEAGLLPSYELAYRRDSELSQHSFGHALSRVDDVNGDGRADMVAGAPTGTAGDDAVYLLAETGAQLTILSRIDSTLSTSMGRSVAGLSDVNGDGVPDFAAGVPRFDTFIVADGSDRTIGGTQDTHPGVLAIENGGSDTHYLGTFLAGLSNGQLLEASRPNVGGIGSNVYWYEPDGTGSIRVKAVLEASYHWRNDPAIRNVGDVIGNDGIDDFLVATDDGVPESPPQLTGSSRGRVSLVSGASSATGHVLLADIETLHFDGPAEDVVLGDSGEGQNPLATAGDFTGDGVMDYIFTANRPNDWSGAAYFYDGATQQMLWELPRPADITHLRGNVENVGDLDGDGQVDIAIAAGIGSQDLLMFYSPTRQAYLGRLWGESLDDQFGRAVVPLGDLNNDGLGDFAVGAAMADFGGENSGSIYVYMSASVPEPATCTLLLIAGCPLVHWARRLGRPV